MGVTPRAVAIAGPRPTVEVHETGSNARTANMSAFTTIALRLLRGAGWRIGIWSAGAGNACDAPPSYRGP